MKAPTCHAVRASLGAGVKLQACLGRQHSDPRWSIFIRESDAGLNSLQCEMCGSMSACMTAPCETMGNNLTHRDNPLRTHSRCTYNTITQNSHNVHKVVSSVCWDNPLATPCTMQSQSTKSHEIQTIIATRSASQTDLEREEWLEWKRYQSASHSFSVTAKQCRSGAEQKLFAKERKHNLICVRFLLCVS